MKGRQKSTNRNKRNSTIDKELDIKMKELDEIQSLVQISEGFLRPDALIEAVLKEVKEKSKQDPLIFRKKTKVKCIIF
jgi:4-hydroxy-3-methylbut-2-enyl diphosphate reductase IspH